MNPVDANIKACAELLSKLPWVDMMVVTRTGIHIWSNKDKRIPPELVAVGQMRGSGFLGLPRSLFEVGWDYAGP